MSYYKYFNPNPKGLEMGDCVIRSLCAATKLTWYEVFDKLTEFARNNCVVLNEGHSKIVESRMKYFGFIRNKIGKPTKGSRSYTVADFCKDHSEGKYILNLQHHMIAVINGEYYDIYPCWDNSKVYCYYELMPDL